MVCCLSKNDFFVVVFVALMKWEGREFRNVANRTWWSIQQEANIKKCHFNHLTCVWAVLLLGDLFILKLFDCHFS